MSGVHLDFLMEHALLYSWNIMFGCFVVFIWFCFGLFVCLILFIFGFVTGPVSDPWDKQ